MEDEQERQPASEPVERTHMSYPEALKEASGDSEPDQGPETEPETEEGPPAESPGPPQAPPTFEQFLMSVAVRAPHLDGAAEAMATDVVREKGFRHVKAWRLPDGSILITKG